MPGRIDWTTRANFLRRCELLGKVARQGSRDSDSPPIAVCHASESTDQNYESRWHATKLRKKNIKQIIQISQGGEPLHSSRNFPSSSVCIPYLYIYCSGASTASLACLIQIDGWSFHKSRWTYLSHSLSMLFGMTPSLEPHGGQESGEDHIFNGPCFCNRFDQSMIRRQMSPIQTWDKDKQLPECDIPWLWNYTCQKMKSLRRYGGPCAQYLWLSKMVVGRMACSKELG